MRIMAHLDAERDEQRRWVKAVARKLGISLSELARQSGLAPSTLNRFVNNPDIDHLLENETLAAVAKTGGVDVLEPPGRARGFGEDAVPFVVDETDVAFARAVKALTQHRNGLAAYQVKGFGLDLLGYMPGDVVIVDLNRGAKAGDVVIAQHYDWSRDKAETLIRSFDPPYLVTASTKLAPQKPLMVDDDTIIIKGVIGPQLRPEKKS